MLSPAGCASNACGVPKPKHQKDCSEHSSIRGRCTDTCGAGRSGQAPQPLVSYFGIRGEPGSQLRRYASTPPNRLPPPRARSYPTPSTRTYSAGLPSLAPPLPPPSTSTTNIDNDDDDDDDDDEKQMDAGKCSVWCDRRRLSPGRSSWRPRSCCGSGRGRRPGTTTRSSAATSCRLTSSPGSGGCARCWRRWRATRSSP